MKTYFSPLPNLATERLFLRPLRLTDAPEMFLHRSNAEMQRFTEITLAKTEADALNFIEKVLANLEEGSSVMWGICPKGEDKIIGSICLWNLNPAEGIAELGYSIYIEHWGKGYATEAVAAVVNFGFEVMKVDIIQAFSQMENLASVKVLQRLGFVQTGLEDKYALFAICRPIPNAIRLETERLLLREATTADAPFFLELFNSPDWLANIGDRGVRNLVDAQRYFVHRIHAIYRKNGFGSYLVIGKSDGATMGFCGLNKRDFLEEFDIGYAFLPAYFGKGFATEAAQAVVDLAKHKLGLTGLKAFTIEENKPSQRVLEKVGLRFERMFQAPGDDEVLMLYGVDF